MGETSTNTAVWGMLAERWRKTIRAKALSANTERGYPYTARRWAEWLAEQGHDIEPAEVEAHHIDDFIEATSAANGAHHSRNLRAEDDRANDDTVRALRQSAEHGAV